MTKQVKGKPATEIEEVEIISETNVPESMPEVEAEANPMKDVSPVEIEFTPEAEKLPSQAKFFESEMLYETTNPNRSSWDLTDVFFPISTISAVERIVDKDRFSDFGCDDPEKHEMYPEDCCVVFTTAYPLGFISISHSYEEVVELMINSNK
jgi:hypothetical protein